MRKNILLLIITFLFAWSNFSSAQWTSFLTNNSDTDYINAIVTQGNTLWAATNGGIVKWNILTGSNSLYTLYYDHNNGIGYGIKSASIDWNGVKWFGASGRIYKYDTTWVSVTPDSTSLKNILSGGLVDSILIDSVNKRIIFAIFRQLGGEYPFVVWGHTLISFDGVKWEKLFDNITGNMGFFIPFVIDTINPWDIWGGSLGNNIYLFKKEAQGYTSNLIRFDIINYPIQSIAIDANNRLWMTSGKTMDVWDRTGLSPTQFGPEITGASYSHNIIIDHNQVKWIGSDSLLIRYDDKKWSDYPFPNLNQFETVTALAVDEQGDIWLGRGSSIGGGGYGLWRFHLATTGVDQETTLPQTIKITGNYPNPFNPSTTITFSIPKSGLVSLVLYNLSGQKVRELVSGPQSAGPHSAVWDGRDDSGKPVSSGVYLSRLQMENKVAVGRMLLLK